MAESDPWNDVLLPRDRYGRPLIAHPETMEAIPYQRASTFCAQLNDHTGIWKWKLRNTVIGMGRYADLQRMAAPLRYDTDAPTDGNGRRMDDRDQLDDIAEMAMDRVGLNEKAHYGTAIHSATEPGRDLDMVPDPRMRGDIEAYRKALVAYGMTVVETEVFVVNDRWQTAGTFDHIYDVPAALLPGGDTGTVRVVGDKKTGKLKLNEHAIQIAVYANGSRYDPTTGEREPLDVSTRWGITWHIPAGEAKAMPYLMDLKEGARAAELAALVRDWRKSEPGELMTPPGDMERAEKLLTEELGARKMTAVEELEHAIRIAASETALAALWRTRRVIWTEKHTEMAATRKAELAAERKQR